MYFRCVLTKIDQLLLKGFVGPFLASFFIALFVLVMQSMWIYIDDIAGKGVGILVVLEMVGFLAIRLIPQALPIGVLIASVMLFGGMAERFELSSLKSAGVSLLRIMRPILLAGGLIGTFSMICSEYLIPAANLEFISRIHDIRKKKAALTLEAGVFEDDFKDMSIRIGSKEVEGNGIYDIRIYDHSQRGSNRLSLVTADHGEMYTSPGGRSFIMKLYDGIQYEEIQSSNGKSKPFTATEFKEWIKVFDMTEFDMAASDQDIFKMHHGALTTRELVHSADSLQAAMFKENAGLYYHFEKLVRTEPPAKMLNKVLDYHPKFKDNLIDSGKVLVLDTIQLSKMDTSIHELIDFTPVGNRIAVLRRAKVQAENYQRKIKSSISTLGRLLDRRVKHVFELHSKFALALVCILFIFLGAPMGAIVRKGGFGYPLLVAVFFFVLFVLMTLSLRRIAESGGIDPVIGAWLPSLVTSLIGSFLTYHGIRDSKLGSDNALMRLIKRTLSKADQSSSAETTVKG